jgi:hypothetical protein
MRTKVDFIPNTMKVGEALKAHGGLTLGLSQPPIGFGKKKK